MRGVHGQQQQQKGGTFTFKDFPHFGAARAITKKSGKKISVPIQKCTTYLGRK